MATDASRPDATHVGIVGGGVLGLTLAWRLHHLGHAVTVFERDATIGGLAGKAEPGGPAVLGDFTWDRFPHVVLESDARLLELVHELGLSDQLDWGIARGGVYISGQPRALSSIRDFLRFPFLGVLDKARIDLTILRLVQGLTDALQQTPAEDWLRRWSGPRAYERFWLPLIKARVGENYAKATVALLPRLVRHTYAARRRAGAHGICGYVAGGFASILDALCTQLVSAGARVETSAHVTRVIDSGTGATVLLKDGRVASFDHVVVTTPAPSAARLCPQLSDEERNRLKAVSYQGVVCMSALLRRPLGSLYATNIAAPGVPFHSVIEMTSLVPAATFGGFHLVYLPRYVAQEDAYWSLSDNTIRNRFLSALGAMYPRLSVNDVVACEVARARHMSTVPRRAVSRDSILPTDTSQARIHIVNAAQITHGAPSTDEIIALANERSAYLAQRFGPREVRVHTPWPAVPAKRSERVPDARGEGIER